MAMPKERWCSLPRAGALCLGLDAIRDESRSTQSLRLAVVGVKNTQGINSPAVRMIAALCARKVVVYGGDESVVYGSTSSCPPYTTHRSHTILPGARRVLRRRMREACRHAASSTNPARVSTTERPFVMLTARGHPMRDTPDRRAARPGGHSFSWAAISESAGLWDVRTAEGRVTCGRLGEPSSAAHAVAACCSSRRPQLQLGRLLGERWARPLGTSTCCSS